MRDKKSDQWDGNSYSENSDLQYRASKAFLALHALHAFKGNEYVLDIGCGNGRITSEIAELVPQGKVIGIDSSDSMITYAKQHYVKPNLSFVLMDAQDFSFKETFDVIISTFCLHWVKDKPSLFQNIAAHLNPNGQALLIMVLFNQTTSKIRQALIRSPEWKDYFKNYIDAAISSRDCDYDQYAKNAGLKNIQYTLEEVTTPFENAEKLMSFLKNITPCLSMLPNDTLKNDFMKSLTETYLAEHVRCEIVYTYAKLRAMK